MTRPRPRTTALLALAAIATTLLALATTLR